jgi:Flp pilus assembly pilin Flp
MTFSILKINRLLQCNELRTRSQARSQREMGQGLIEYLILVSLISVCAISVVTVVGKNIKEQYARVSNALRGESKSRIELTKPGAETYQSHGMDNFTEGAVTSGGRRD